MSMVMVLGLFVLLPLLVIGLAIFGVCAAKTKCWAKKEQQPPLSDINIIALGGVGIPGVNVNGM